MTASPVTIEQELARIIDPLAWERHDGLNRLPNPEAADEGRRRAGMLTREGLIAPSLKTARAILDRLALSGEPVAWRVNYPDGSAGLEFTEWDADEVIAEARDPANTTKTPPYLSPLSPDRGEDKGSEPDLEDVREALADAWPEDRDDILASDPIACIGTLIAERDEYICSDAAANEEIARLRAQHHATSARLNRVLSICARIRWLQRDDLSLHPAADEDPSRSALNDLALLMLDDAFSAALSQREG